MLWCKQRHSNDAGISDVITFSDWLYEKCRTLVNLLLVLLVLLGTDQNLWEYGTRQRDFFATKFTGGPVYLKFLYSVYFSDF